MKKKTPYVLLLILILVLFFIMGIRYGQNVEKANKTIDYLISIAPTKPVATPTESIIEYRSYTHKGCGIGFLYPSILKNEVDSSTSGKLSSPNVSVSFSCLPDNPIAQIIDDTIASEEIKLQNKNFKAKVKSDIFYFETRNPINYKRIFVQISKSLYPLFEKSLEYSP